MVFKLLKIVFAAINPNTNSLIPCLSLFYNTCLLGNSLVKRKKDLNFDEFFVINGSRFCFVGFITTGILEKIH